ncbi:MAG: hypothetical protein KGJ13_10380 [Patescibacteria group bacterium]|nr:hypothetical protein [Patescibacteria group bacterium]
MKSTVICIRLNAEELGWLDRYVAGGVGFTGRSEYFRYLLHHEHDRRANTKTPARAWSSEWRNGKPANKSKRA